MKRILLLSFLCTIFFIGYAQKELSPANKVNTTTIKIAPPKKQSGGLLKLNVVPETAKDLMVEKQNAASPVKNQGNTGTCWDFSATSLLESQYLKNKNGVVLPDLSEMYTARKIYEEKAENYFLRQGKAQFGEGGLGHDLIRSVALYGAMPESVFKAKLNAGGLIDHSLLITSLKSYLDTMIAHDLSRDKMPGNWRAGVKKYLDEYIGEVPEAFKYEGKGYTPKSFAKDYLRFNEGEYVNITSFTNHVYYTPFVLSIPDNFSNGSYYNLPLEEMIDITKNAVRNGYTVLWDGDVSNNGFSQEHGAAMYIPESAAITGDDQLGNYELNYTADIRQALFENLTTQDDHLMQITGLAKSNKTGKTFFMVKNSWGEVGPAKGYLNLSQAYFAINTISLIVPKASLSKALLEKMHIN